MTKEKKNNTRRNLLIIILALLCLIAIGVSIWAIWFREKKPNIADYAPQTLEPNAQPMEEEEVSKMDAPEGGGAISLAYGTDVTIDLASKKATLYFGNPSKSTQDIVLQIVIEDEVIVQTGRIEPGNEVSTLELSDSADDILQIGQYDGKFVILAYNPESGEKAMVNTEIPLSISVV